jgi:cellulose synthase/poly-beta-1,6-N-acetylglucosamine synthase-like glycosyltransferase
MIVVFYAAFFFIWLMLLYHTFLMIGGFIHGLINRRKLAAWKESLKEYPTVSVLIPAHNEEVVIGNTLEAMMELNYPKDRLEVIVINDNSSDRTGDIVKRFSLIANNIRCMTTPPLHAGKGKSSALNEGFRRSKGSIIVVYDADNTPEPDAVLNLVLALENDAKAAAVVGKFRVINASKTLLTKFINIETITFQWMAQAGRWFWFKMCTIPGTNFAIRRSVIEELGGWDEKALSEDTELSIRVYNQGYHIRFFPAAVTWEQEPENWKVWWRQRTRWARGNEYVVMKYVLQLFKLKNPVVVFDLLYFFFTYFFFFIGVIVSDILVVYNLTTDAGIGIGAYSIYLLLAGYLLYVAEVILALSIEGNQLSFKNFLIVLFMYFTYSQLWILLVIRAFYLEIKRMLFKQEIKWYKTERFNVEHHKSA